MNNNFNRLFLGGLIGLLGGVSFGMTVLPWAVEQFLSTIPTDTFLRMARIAVPAALLWIPGGAIAGLQGGARNGLMVMGTASLIAGGIYGIIVGGGALSLIGVSALVAAVYGGGAGILVGGGLPKPQAEPDQ